jgi:hypothetical protein
VANDQLADTPPSQQAEPATPAQPATTPEPPTQQAEPGTQSGQPFVHPALGTLEIRGADPDVPIWAVDHIEKHG